jgi:hypothetical protein
MAYFIGLYFFYSLTIWKYFYFSNNSAAYVLLFIAQLKKKYTYSIGFGLKGDFDVAC